MLYILVSCLALLCCGVAYGQIGSCEVHPETSVRAYTDWPFRLDCDDLRKLWQKDDRRSVSDEIECQIWNSTEHKDEGIFEISSIEAPKLYTAKLTINGSICLQNDIEVQVQHFPNETCQDYVQHSYTNETARFVEGTMMGSLNLRCIPPEGSPVPIPTGANRKDFTTRWSLDCDKWGDRGAYRSVGDNVADPEGFPDQLQLYGIDFYDAGDFVCEVTHKGRTLRVVNTGVCIKQSAKFVTPTLTCTQTETEVLGGNATLNCAGQVVIGVLYPGDLVIEWKKDGEIMCSNRIYNKTEYGSVDGRHSCFAMGDNSSITCVDDAYDNDGIQGTRRRVEMKFMIRGLKEEEFANYSVVLRYKSQEAKGSVVLYRDWTPYYVWMVSILSGVLISIIAVVLLALGLRYFKIYILLFFKRSFLRKHDKDDKKYVAYLSYFYDNEMETKSLKTTSACIYSIQSQLEKLGYNYYDEQREDDFSTGVEKVTNLIENCHRMVILLTPEYLNDKWMRFHAGQGFYGMLESRMGLVFITVPGVRKLLVEKARKDKVWHKVLAAVKTSYVIKWKEGSEERFQHHIEYALPKLLRERRQRVLSASSEIGFSPPFARSMSENTECITIPSSPESYGVIYENEMAELSYPTNNNADKKTGQEV